MQFYEQCHMFLDNVSDIEVLHPNMIGKQSSQRRISFILFNENLIKHPQHHLYLLRGNS